MSVKGRLTRRREREGQRRNGFSWADIGRGLGVTRQAAQMTWGRHVEDLEHAETRAMLRELAG